MVSLVNIAACMVLSFVPAYMYYRGHDNVAENLYRVATLPDYANDLLKKIINKILQS